MPIAHHHRRTLSELRCRRGSAEDPGRAFHRPLRGRTDPGRIDAEARPRRGLATDCRASPIGMAIRSSSIRFARFWTTSISCRSPIARTSITAARNCRWLRGWAAGGARGTAASAASVHSMRPRAASSGSSLPTPAAVVEEMRLLHFEQGAEMFLFQDDDFMATGRRARRWAEDIAKWNYRGGA